MCSYLVRDTFGTSMVYLLMELILMGKKTYSRHIFVEMYVSLTGFYPSTFGYSCFSAKIQFLYCLLSSLSLNLGLQI